MTFTDRLRADVWPRIGDRPVTDVAREIGVSRWTLWRFLSGKPVGARALDAIERWVRVAGLHPKPN